MSSFNFDFNKGTNQAELNKLTEVDAPKTQADMPELTDNTPNELENHNETEPKAEEKKAVLTYVGNSKWVDSEDEAWTNGATRSYLESEYEKRDDLKFMVRYGEMRLALV